MSPSASSSSIPDLIGRTIDEDRLQLVRVLGSGAFGVVYLAATTDKVPHLHMKFAVKCIRWDSSEGRSLPMEIDLHFACSNISPGVLQAYNIVVDEVENLIFIVMEYCPDGGLMGIIESGRYEGNDELLKSVFLQILDAVEECHESNVTHRDLKPQNILCKDGGEQIVLADFGLASTATSSKQFGYGSKPYMSPEVLGGLNGERARYSTQLADIWALGVILVNMTCCYYPWAKASLKDPRFLKFITREPDYLLRTLPISRELNDILKSLFTADPLERTSIPVLRARIRRARHLGVAGTTPIKEISTMHANKSVRVDRDYIDDILAEIYPVGVHTVLTVRDHYASDAEDDKIVVPTNHFAIHAPAHHRRAASLPSAAVVSGASGTYADAEDTEDRDSDDESEGPITPEQYAVGIGHAAVHLEDVPDFPGAGGSGADPVVSIHVNGHAQLQVFACKALSAEDARNVIDPKLTGAVAEAAGCGHRGPSARNMLRL